MRGASRTIATLATGLALAAAGCGGGGGGDPKETTARTTAPAPPGGVAVRVVDGDTGAPIAGAQVTALRGAQPSVTTNADGSGRTTVPVDTRFLRVTAPGRTGSPVSVSGREVVARLYDPALQSPQYGGGPSRTRYVPGVDVAPPARGHRPAWRFTSRTLLEFPPAVSNGLLVVGTNSGRVYALDSATGKLRWARRQRGEIASTPAITADRVLVSSMDGRVTAYGLGGLRRWSFSTHGSPTESSPLVVDGTAYIGTSDGTVYALDARTGRLRWRATSPGAVKGSGALAAGRIVFGDYKGYVTAFNPRTGAIAWRVRAGQQFYGGPGVSGNHIVIGDVGGQVVGLDATSGAVRWQRSTGGSYVYSSPAIAGGHAFIGSYNGNFQALDVATGAVRWSYNAHERISGSATVVGGVVYTAVLARPGSPRHTDGLDVRTGALRFRTAEGRYSPAVAAGRTLYLIGTRTIEAYRATTP